jgi:hypothetical protein
MTSITQDNAPSTTSGPGSIDKEEAGYPEGHSKDLSKPNASGTKTGKLWTSLGAEEGHDTRRAMQSRHLVMIGWSCDAVRYRCSVLISIFPLQLLEALSGQGSS